MRSAAPPHNVILAAVGTMPKERDLQEAYGRAVLSGWIALIDLQLVADPRGPAFPPLLQKVFQLTALGQSRLAALRVYAR